MPKEIITITVKRPLPDACEPRNLPQQLADEKELETLLKKLLFPMAETVTVTYEVENA
jgi:hypothetical protein